MCRILMVGLRKAVWVLAEALGGYARTRLIYAIVISGFIASHATSSDELRYPFTKASLP